MLERRRRIHTDRDHRTVWRTGRVIRGRTVVLRYAPSTETQSRYGFVVSSAIAKRANVRNVVKRRLRVIARKAELKRPLDIVVYATKAAPVATFAELQTDFLQTLGLLNAQNSPRRH